MPININCKHFRNGTCGDKRTKRSFFGLGPRYCKLCSGPIYVEGEGYQPVTCEYQEEYSRPPSIRVVQSEKNIIHTN